MSFNLKQHLEKTANYEGAQGYFVGQTRTWQNCVRLKRNAGGTAMEAWEDCLESYQKDNGSLKWIADNVHEDFAKPLNYIAENDLEMKEWTDLINIQLHAGNTIEAAVSNTISFFKEAASSKKICGCKQDKCGLPKK